MAEASGNYCSPNPGSSTAPIQQQRPKFKQSMSVSTPAEHRSRTLNRTLTRGQSIKENITNRTGAFFGIDADPGSLDTKWQQRRMRHVSRRYGGVRGSTEQMDIGVYSPTTPGMRPSFQRQSTLPSEYYSATLNRSFSIDSKTPASGHPRLVRRDSVAKMAWDGLSSLVKTGHARQRPISATTKRQRYLSRSFAPSSMADDTQSPFWPDSTLDGSAVELRTMHTDGSSVLTDRTSTRPMGMIPEIRSESTDSDAYPVEALTRRLESATLESGIPAARPIFQRTNTIETCAESGISNITDDDVFFDNICPTPSSAGRPHSFHHFKPPVEKKQPQLRLQLTHPRVSEETEEEFKKEQSMVPDLGRVAPMSAPIARIEHVDFDGADGIGPKVDVVPEVVIRQPKPRPNLKILLPPPHAGEFRERQFVPLDVMPRRKPRRPPTSVKSKKPPTKEPINCQNCWSRAVSAVLDRSKQRRRLGEGCVGRLFGWKIKRKAEMDSFVFTQWDESHDDHRPYFTYWITTVQILVMIVALACYGLGPIGFQKARTTAKVQLASMSYGQVEFFEHQNFWIGPRHADLVHLGAKYSPCMRPDKHVLDNAAEHREREDASGCCFRNQDNTCHQESEKECVNSGTQFIDSPYLIKHDSKYSYNGVVCGMDPRLCTNPKSIEPVKWSSNITQWPICVDTDLPSTTKELHMSCEVTGRPCCIGIQGKCRITSKNYCDVVKGYYHEDAFLCAQVQCMHDVCGMIPLTNGPSPSQFYRLFVAIFLHAGIFHCCCTVVVQFFLMRDLEKLLGWARLSVIYICAGIGGNLASAIFVPYLAEVGPSGSHFGLLAGLFVDAIYSWHLIAKPKKALLQLCVVTAILFVLGLLPWIDNWANLFGFVFGLLLSFAVFPYIQFPQVRTVARGRMRRVVIVAASLTCSLGLFALLLILFYVSPVWECEVCKYFNCIPITADFCVNLDMYPAESREIVL